MRKLLRFRTLTSISTHKGIQKDYYSSIEREIERVCVSV